jgi:hypothetical protein
VCGRFTQQFTRQELHALRLDQRAAEHRTTLPPRADAKGVAGAVQQRDQGSTHFWLWHQAATGDFPLRVDGGRSDRRGSAPHFMSTRPRRLLRRVATGSAAGNVLVWFCRHRRLRAAYRFAFADISAIPILPEPEIQEQSPMAADGKNNASAIAGRSPRRG